VIGRHQDPHKECNLSFMKKNDVTLARRPIGGGALYHDLGDTCWAFVEPTPHLKSNADIIVSALKYIGLPAIGTSHGVVQIADHQIVRSIVLKIGDQTVHHGILRVNPNDAELKRSLSRKPLADLPTLSDIKPMLNHAIICEALLHAFKVHANKVAVKYSDTRTMLGEKRTKDKFEQLSSPNWIYGRSSPGNTRVSREFDFGSFDVALKLDGETLKGARVNSDCMRTDVVEKFEDCINRFRTSVLPPNYLGREYIESLNTPEEKEMAEALFSWILPEMKKFKGKRE
jgi:lipoate-protein ligase A